jgi:hypothetical protein
MYYTLFSAYTIYSLVTSNGSCLRLDAVFASIRFNIFYHLLRPLLHFDCRDGRIFIFFVESLEDPVVHCPLRQRRSFHSAEEIFPILCRLLKSKYTGSIRWGTYFCTSPQNVPDYVWPDQPSQTRTFEGIQHIVPYHENVYIEFLLGN